MKKFLIIPGLPRCATTSFAQILSQHPGIFLPKIKEPHYFLPNKDKYFMFNRKGNKIPFDKCGFISSQKDFDDNYDNYKSDQIYIDGSTLYTSYHESMYEIYKQKEIDPYFIILKRDPFKRAVSHYLYSVSRGEEFRKFDEALLDEKYGVYNDWLLKGYLAGSDSTACEEKIRALWGESKMIIVNIDIDNVFSQTFMDRVLSFLNIHEHSFKFSKTANALTYTDNRLVREIRIILKRARQLNPTIMDNKLTRSLFNKFIRSIPVNKGIYEQYLIYEDLYNTLYESMVPI